MKIQLSNFIPSFNSDFNSATFLILPNLQSHINMIYIVEFNYQIMHADISVICNISVCNS
ncbi:hypothetical protein Avbf_15351 [Armadillidium vulgare]|nr:hypothetical protein Avbf_15351 [Armadillidium vulgare]